jgi:hypothetical protein
MFEIVDGLMSMKMDIYRQQEQQETDLMIIKNLETSIQTTST